MSATIPAVEYVPCNLCGNDDTQTIYAEVPRIHSPNTAVVQCNHCGLVYLNPRLKNLADNFTMNDAYLREHYLPFYQSLGLLAADGAILPEENSRFHREYLQNIQPYRRNNRLLDVGCAIGVFLAAAQQAGWQGYGLDPSGPLSAYGRDQYGLTIHESELHTLAFPKNHFDVVTLWNVIEHLLDPSAVLREVYRVLRPGGLLVLQMPNWDNVARDFLGVDWDMFVTDHFYYFSPSTTQRLLQQGGFVPRKIDAPILVESEITEIATKVSPEAAAQARQQMQQTQSARRGSTITAYAEKPITNADRLAQGAQLLTTGQWRTLFGEATNYLRWRLRGNQSP